MFLKISDFSDEEDSAKENESLFHSGIVRRKDRVKYKINLFIDNRNQEHSLLLMS